MKNKIIALTLGLILALSPTTAFAADLNIMDFSGFNDFLNSYNINYFEPSTAPETAEAEQTTEPAVAEQTTEPAVAEQTADEAKDYDYTEQQTANQAPEQTANQPSQESSNYSAVSSNSGYEKSVAQLVNAEREKNGLQPLTFDSSISNVARTKSKDMADNNYFAHQSPTYGSAGDMLRQSGINWSAWGENIASGQNTPEEVVNAWMNSPSHRENILSPNFSKIGVGYVVSANGTPYWTQMFTN